MQKAWGEVDLPAFPDPLDRFRGQTGHAMRGWQTQKSPAQGRDFGFLVAGAGSQPATHRFRADSSTVTVNKAFSESKTEHTQKACWTQLVTFG